MKKTNLVQVLIQCVTIFLLFNFTGCNFRNDIENFENASLDIESAYMMAITEAQKWNSNAETYLATSTDSNYEDISQGIDGKRNAWTFSFVVRNTNKCFNVFIKDGRIDHTQEVISAFNEDLILPKGNLQIGSKKAVDIVRKYMGLLPGKDWAVGYHFSLKNIDGKLGLIVSGRDKDNQRTSFNACQIATPIIQEAYEDCEKIELNRQMDTNHQQYVFDQNATAYLSAQGAKTASGKTAAIGMVAVHPKTYSSNTTTAVKSGPVIPFGTVITINQSFSSLKYVTFPGSTKQYTQFVVEDLGQLNHQQGYSTWWVDIYFGVDNAVNRKAAEEFGNEHRISYTYWAPIDI